MNRVIDLAVNPNWAKLPLFERSQWKRVRFGDVVENLNETCDLGEAGLERFHCDGASGTGVAARSW